MLTPLTPDTPDFAALHALNNKNAQALSLTDADAFAHLLRQAFFAASINGTEAFIIAFDQNANYESPNFLWFRERFAHFIYIDRVVTDISARGRGHAAALYEALFAKAQASGHDLVVCEVNEEPPNPASDAFHAKLGFTVAGSATLPESGKKVRYYFKHL